MFGTNPLYQLYWKLNEGNPYMLPGVKWPWRESWTHGDQIRETPIPADEWDDDKSNPPPLETIPPSRLRPKRGPKWRHGHKAPKRPRTRRVGRFRVRATNPNSGWYVNKKRKRTAKLIRNTTKARTYYG